MKLTAKQEAFCVEYVRCGNASEAYRVAYGPGRMSAKTIHEKASRLLSTGNVRARVSELQSAIADEAVIDEARTARTLAAVAFADPKDLYDEHGELRPVRDLPFEVRMAISSVKTRRIPGTPAVIDEIKLLNRSVSLDALVRLAGLAGRTPLPGLAAAETLTEQGRAVLQALATGTIAPGAAASVLSALAAQAKITEIDELEQRVRSLEEAQKEKPS